jgi:hypothetical protein
MSSGDAYIYCLIISEDAACKINRLLNVIGKKQKEVDEILQSKNDDGNPQVKAIVNQIRLSRSGSERGLKLLDHIQKLQQGIINSCKNPIAIFHVADDSWNEAYHACDEAMYTPTSVSMFLNQTGGKIWCKDELVEKYRNHVCICLPSHYDTDSEFLDELGVKTRRLEDYNAHKRTEPICRTEYVLVNLINGEIADTGSLSSVAYEWARRRYEFGDTDCEVREVEVREIRVVDKKELDQVVDETFGDESQYGIEWHVDKHEEKED